MKRISQLALLAVVGAAGTTLLSWPRPIAATEDGAAAEAVASLAAGIIADAIPRHYERTKDWGRTRRITSGLRSSGNFFDFNVRRRTSDVNHGVWKHYRVQIVEPDESLLVRIDNLRSVGSGRTASTLFVSAKLHLWARAKVYEHGVHLIAVDAEGEANVRLWIDSEIALQTVPSSTFLPGVALHPVVTDARLEFDQFHLRRISSLRGPLARELGNGLRRMIQDELSGPKLVAQLNRTIDKRRDRLQLSPDRLFGRSTNHSVLER